MVLRMEVFVSLRDDDDFGESPTRDLKRPALPPPHLKLVPGRKTDLDAPDEAYTKALPDPEKPSAA